MDRLTQPEPAASRRELEALAARVSSIDDLGTRGGGGIQVQLTELAKDLAKLEGRLDAHQAQHEREQRERITGRRWLVATGVAMISALAAMAGTLAAIAQHLH